MSDPISSVALIVAIFSGLASLMNTLHIRKCNAGCCKSDCSKGSGNSPPTSPPPQLPKKKGVSFEDEKDSNISV
jgi:hypothetical protein